MSPRKTKAPTTQHGFCSAWAELEYLCKKVSYWLHVRRRPTQAERYAERLGRVLRQLRADDLAIIREEGLALLAELRGKVDEAVEHRQREIQLMVRLHQEAESPRYSDATRRYMLQNRGSAVLKQRQEILAALEKSKTRIRREVIRQVS